MRTHPFALLLLAALVLALPGCKLGTDGEDHGDAALVEVVDGSGQQGTVGQPLAQPVRVRVVDDRGRPVPGVSVNFVVTSGGGSVPAAAVTTDEEGMAATAWTLGTRADVAQTLEARVGAPSGQAIVSEPVTATPRAGAATRLLAASDSMDLGGAVGGPARDSLAVRALDPHGNPVAGVTVNWGIGQGGGSVSPASGTTDAQGRASAQWTLGPATNVVQAAVASASGTNQVAFFGRAGDTLLMLTPGGRTATAGHSVQVAVSLNGAEAGPVPGARVHWTVVSGGGSVTAASSITERSRGNVGEATAQWTLGPAGGAQTLRASVGPLQQTITITAIAQGSRTLVAQVPGRVLDAAADRVLWLDSAGTRLIKIRTVSTGADVTVKTDTATSGRVSGFLFPGGALVADGQNALFEYRNGTLSHLGTGTLSVEGEWAAWSDEASVVRRDLSAGASQVVAAGAAASVDVGADGDVVFLQAGGAWRYSGGTLSPVTLEEAADRIETDGVNVVYARSSLLQGRTTLWLDQPGGDVVLAQHSSRVTAVYDRLNGGWIAYSTPASAVFRRSPAGAVAQASSETSTRVEALAPDGTLIYRTPPLNTGRFYVVTPGGARSDVGVAATQDRVVWRDDRFLLLSRGSVYRLSP